jgi:hypothetical protein
MFYRDKTMGGTQVFEWLYKLKNAVTSAEDAEHSGYALTSKTDENVD